MGCEHTAATRRAPGGDEEGRGEDCEDSEALTRPGQGGEGQAALGPPAGNTKDDGEHWRSPLWVPLTWVLAGQWPAHTHLGRGTGGGAGRGG